MFEYAQTVIDVVDEQTITTFERAKAVAAEREERSQSQGIIMKTISKMVGQQRLEVTSLFTRQLFNDLWRQLSIELEG